MFLPESDVKEWKADMKRFDDQRKTAAQDPARHQFSKPVTWKEVKQKEVEYHPILQKFASDTKETTEKMKETSTWNHKAEAKKKNVERYLPEYNIINLEKDTNINHREDPKGPKARLMPAAQVDYNIITNGRLDEVHFQNVKLNVNSKKKHERKANHGPQKDFNIVSNMYLQDHETKHNADSYKASSDLKDKYQKSHDYNIMLGEYYDKNKEANYQEKRQKEQHDHGKKVIERLPPTIKDRETIIFDNTREVPEAIKKLDQKKKDAMKKYEVRYKVEEQVRERDLKEQEKNDHAKMARINDKKFTEHLDKGFDILTLNDYDKSQLKYQSKPNPTKWEKLRLTSNPSAQVIQMTRAPSEKAGLTSSDLKQEGTRFENGPRSAQTGGWKETMRANSMIAAEASKSNTKYDPQEFANTKDFKSAYQRSKEPAYNLADKYNKYCVPPQRVVDDFNTRTLPQIKVSDTTLKFGATSTGTFKRGGESVVSH